MKVFFITLFFLLQLKAHSSNEQYIIKNPNREGVIKACTLKTPQLNSTSAFVAIKSTMERYTKIANAYDVIVILENGKFNSNRSDDFSAIKKAFVQGTNQVTSFKMGLATDRLPDGTCLRVIVPDDTKLTKDASYISNDSSLKLDFHVLPDVETKFNKLHFESCKKKYCVNEHFGDDCDYECVKPNKLFATSDLDNNKLTEYWYDTLTSIGRVIFVVEQEKNGLGILMLARQTQPVD